jgi:acetylornithine deacetylase/succinyl-diaminopimelate desuccinylase-like protein
MSVTAYLDANHDRQLSELVEFAAIPSISALSEHRADIERCAQWLHEYMQRLGLERVQLLRCGGNPVAYGEWLHAPAGAPTVLIYGHYDVQPADPLELWTSPPFEPTVRDGHIYARGISDNKGQIFTVLAGLEAALAAEGGLACNVKVIVEGEEELRADYLDELMRSEPELLAADVLLNSDSTFLSPDVPSVPIGLRGMVALELTVRTGTTDLHSGLFGGVAPNALQTMAAILATLKDRDGRILVDGYYDDVLDISAEELAAWARLGIDDAAVLEQTGVFALMAEPGYGLLHRQWARPTLDVVGMWGGFQGEGLKTIIPAAAHAKISCRLVPDQGMQDILDKLEAHLRRVTPPGAELTIDWRLPGAPAMLTPTDHPAVLAAVDALTETFGRRAELVRQGFSVPVNEIAQRNLGLPSVMLGFASPTDAFHAPDERFSLASFEAGRRTAIEFLRGYAARAGAAPVA